MTERDDRTTMAALRQIARRWRGALEAHDDAAAAREADAALFVIEMTDPRPQSTAAEAPRSGMRLRALAAGTLFQTLEELETIGAAAPIFEARGSGWFSTRLGYDGGPWHNPDLRVRILPHARALELEEGRRDA